MPRPTLKDIAGAAGVGTATVERVLNGRGGVGPDKVEKVVAAARALNYGRPLPEQHRGILRIEVILMRPETPFFRRLANAFERIAASLDSSISVQRTFPDERDAGSIVRRILHPPARRSGLIIATPEHPDIRDALVDLRRQGLPIVQVVTPIAGLDADFVGIDNAAAGRTCGHLMARMAAGRGSVVAVCHSPIYRIHRERIAGFSATIARDGGDRLAFREVLFGHDEDARTDELIRAAIDRNPDLVGIYNAGGANGAIVAALRRHARPRGIVFAGHELDDGSAGALRDGLMSFVLDQMPEAQARRAIDLMLGRLGLVAPIANNAPIRFVTVTPENV